MKRIIAILTLIAILASTLFVASFAEESTGIYITEIKGKASVGGFTVIGETDKITHSNENMYTNFGSYKSGEETIYNESYGVIRYALSEIPENQDTYLFTVGSNVNNDSMYGKMRSDDMYEFGIYDVTGLNDTWISASGLTPSAMSVTGNKEDIKFELISTTTSENDEEIIKPESINTTVPNRYNGWRIIADVTSYMKNKLAAFKASGKEEEYVTLAIRPIAFYDWETGEKLEGFRQPILNQVTDSVACNMYPRIRAISYDTPVTDERVFYDVNNGKKYVFGSYPENVEFDEVGMLYSTDAEDFDASDINGESVKALPAKVFKENDNRFGIGFSDSRSGLSQFAYVKSFFRIGNTYVYGDTVEISNTYGFVTDAEYTGGRMYPEFSLDRDEYYVTPENDEIGKINLTLADGVEEFSRIDASAIGETTTISVMGSNGILKELKFHFVDDASGSSISVASAALNAYAPDTLENVTTNSNTGVSSLKGSMYIVNRKESADGWGMIQFDISNVSIMTNSIKIQLVGYNRSNLPVDFDVYYADAVNDFVVDPWTATYNNVITEKKVTDLEYICSPDIDAARAEMAEMTGNYYKPEAFNIDVTDAVRKAKLAGKKIATFIIKPSDSYWSREEAGTSTFKQFFLSWNGANVSDANKPSLTWEYIAPPVPFENGALKTLSFPYGEMYPEAYSADNDDYYFISADNRTDGVMYTTLDGIEVIAEEKATAIGGTTTLTVMDAQGNAKEIRFHFVDSSLLKTGKSAIINSATVNPTKPGTANTKSQWVCMIERKTSSDEIAIFEFDISKVNIMNEVDLQLVLYSTNLEYADDVDVYSADVADGYVINRETITYTDAFESGKIVRGEKIATVDIDVAKLAGEEDRNTNASYYDVDSLKVDITSAVRKAKLEGKDKVAFILETNGAYWVNNPETTKTSVQFYMSGAFTSEVHRPYITWDYTLPAEYVPFPNGALASLTYTGGKMYPEAYSPEYADYYVLDEDGVLDGLAVTYPAGVSELSTDAATQAGETTTITVVNDFSEVKEVRIHYVDKTENTTGLFAKDSAELYSATESYKNTPYSLSTKSDGTKVIKTSLYMTDQEKIGDKVALIEYDITNVNPLADNILLHLVGKNRANLPFECAVYSTVADNAFVLDAWTTTWNNSIGSGSVKQDALIGTIDAAAAATQIAAITSGSYYKIDALKFDVTEAVRIAKAKGESRIIFLIQPTGAYWNSENTGTTAPTFYLMSAHGDYPDNPKYSPTMTWSFN